MKILGIETSCDETSIAVLEVVPSSHKASKDKQKTKVKVLSNTISSQIKIHAKYGGVYPALAAREHAKNIDKVLKLTLKEAGLKSVEEVDLIAVTKGPGLAVALIVGITFAKTLAWKFKKPIAGVNHLEGHIYSNWLPPKDLDYRLLTIDDRLFPALCLIVSGGHTELVLMKDHGKFKIIGETLDDAAGEAFDKIARLLGLGYPGGPLISKEAEKFCKSAIQPTLDPRLLAREFSSGCMADLLQISLPRPMINSKNFDFSFSGLKTAVLYLISRLNLEKPRPGLETGPSRCHLDYLPDDLDEIRPAVALEAQQAIVDVLISKTLRAAKQYKVKSVLLSGGVSANKLLRETMDEKIAKFNKEPPRLNLGGVIFTPPRYSLYLG
ncbi:MAG: tRNA (adenosine(37)-N6)-threonylcarbamoyltransferase complex transferase subunit TsaD [Candidatus Yanofskybacteria bacterium RIFCSPLOWO2_02_FULL_43_10b]|uniref:tRNA N6-adenosine threonylcarbamoyltransferase n=1 Tax=Candidatus Yanofskybacteria bacterium RIFCSPLOWO2_02_FULL_43_10b TaxID=1802704 RepID=A0A1F8H6B9_9BACT|nr:MAG: tRNA (adenosine(37)-N6)-threonylcarbamoyltransferase complex transferase subunit TsaD [Candidatus Yanofskybacteria bacterium RIFCSPLOWO2_02_FULL_43_10b]